MFAGVLSEVLLDFAPIGSRVTFVTVAAARLAGYIQTGLTTGDVTHSP
jgi:hypothetical protein